MAPSVLAQNEGREASRCISEECKCSIDGKPTINRVFCTDDVFDLRRSS